MDAKKNLSAVVIFRWDVDKKRIFSALAKKRGLSPSQYLRALLDSFLSKRVGG